MLYGSRIPMTPAAPVNNDRQAPDGLLLAFSFDATDRGVLHRVGVSPVSSGDTVWSTEQVNEAVYLLDRAAEEGDTEAGELATYLLLAGDVYHEAASDARTVD